VQEDQYRRERYPEWQVLSGPAGRAPRRARPGQRAHSANSDASRWHWLLAVPVVLALAVPMYNRLSPTLFGIPFFYWWQLFLAFVCSGVISAVHLATRDRT
jgi:hypothetical protein